MFNLMFDRFVDPARLRPQLWRLVLGSVLIFLIYLLGLAILFGLIWLSVGRASFMLWLGRIANPTTPAATLIVMASFIGMAIAPMIVARRVHKRAAATLFGPRVRVMRDFAMTSAIVLALYSVLLGVWSLQFDAIPNLPWTLWLSLLPLAICGLLVQTLAEELIFRAYLMQQLAARFKSPLIWMLLPSLAFGLVHYDPTTAGANTWIVVGSAAAFGLVAADLTRLTGTIGAAWGYHFANNLIAIVVLSTDNTITGLSRYLTPYSINDSDLVPMLTIGDLMTMILVWLILRRVLRR